MFLNLNQLKPHIVDFDSFQLSRLFDLQCRWNYQSDSPQLNVLITVAYETPTAPLALTFQLEGVRDLNLPGLSGSFYEFLELEILDVSDSQMEGLNLHLTGGENNLYCYCAALRFTAVQTIEQNMPADYLWQETPPAA